MSAPIGAERWLAIAGYPGYEVSDLGRVRSVDRWVRLKNGRMRFAAGRVLSQSSIKSGHRTVCLYVGAAGRTVLVHRVVLEAFVGPCPTGNECCHGEGGPADNTVANLRWDTHAENKLDRVRQGVDHYAARTHCKFGHELSGDNVKVKRNARVCIACERRRGAESHRRKRERMAAA